MFWENMTSKQHAAVAVDKTLAVLSIGSIEQHGPALPVCTDSLIGWELCLALEQALQSEVILLPQVKVCYSAHHMGSAGSLTVSHESLIAYLSDIVNSLIRQGYRKILFYNSHGGNQAVMQLLLEKIGDTYRDVDIVGTSWWTLCPSEELRLIRESGFMGNGHAGEFEFSLVEHLRKDLIDYTSKSAGSRPQIPLEQAKGDLVEGGSARILRNFGEMTVDGTVGLTEHANNEKGRQLFKLALDHFKKLALDVVALPPRQSGQAQK